jgi:DNA-binding XRE family transcriptional regulator
MQGKDLKEVRRHLAMTQEEFGKALGLTSTFIGMMERGEKPIEDRTALAARQLFNDRSRLNTSHRVTETDEDVPLSDAMILWDEEPQGGRRIVVVVRGDDDDPAFSSSYGACNDEWTAADGVGRLLRLLAKFVELTVQEGLKPKEVHQAFSVIPEYRRSLHFTMFREGVSVD